MAIPSERSTTPASRAKTDSGPLVLAAGAARRASTTHVRRYHRLDITMPARMPDGPVLFVMNHGFGGAADLNVVAALAALDDLSLTRDVTILCHQIAWTMGCGKIVEAGGARPASHESATQAFRLGHHVLVAPGGDVEAAKSFADRDRIVFSGRRGFARLAVENRVPIVPIVTAGAGESLLVLSDGQWLARALRLDTALRLKVLPVSLSVPWGLTLGLPALLPYLALPTKLTTAVLDPLWPEDGCSATALGERVERVMLEALTRMTEHRKLLLG